LILSILQMLPGISISNGIPTILFPLTLVIFVTMIKDALEDKKRNESDKEENNSKTNILHHHKQCNHDYFVNSSKIVEKSYINS